MDIIHDITKLMWTSVINKQTKKAYLGVFVVLDGWLSGRN